MKWPIIKANTNKRIIQEGDQHRQNRWCGELLKKKFVVDYPIVTRGLPSSFIHVVVTSSIFRKPFSPGQVGKIDAEND